jgi:branched-chain amino acid transport system permease protein
LVGRLLKNFRFGVLPVPGRLIAIIFFVFLFIFPLITQQHYYTDMMIYTSIFAIFAVSWDLLSGYSGQLNFGHALFFGVAAYTSALLSSYFHWPAAATMTLGILAAVAAGVITCFPALRLRGPYLALLTLAFPLMLLGIVMFFKDITGAEYGIPFIPHIADTRTGEYYICLIAMTVSVLIMWKLTDAGSKYIRTGLIFHAIREDEIAARATGINTIRYKLLAFAIGGFFAGLAGVLYVHVRGICTIGTLNLTMSFQAIIWVIFGGIVSIYGAVVGVYVLYPLMYLSYDIQSIIERISAAVPNVPALVPLLKILQFLEKLSGQPLLIMAIIVILILLFMPEGVAVWIRDKIERECPRCKLTNGAWRRECRACGASLYTERKAISQ